MIRALLLTAVLLALGATAAQARYVDFRTPSGNIGCGYTDDPRHLLRCDILQSSDMPRKPRSCDLDYGYAYAMNRHSKASTLCAGDTVVNQNARVLQYGKTKRIGGFTCRSRMRGLRCRNKSEHGFFLSRADIRKF
jgi:hypothetical protein